jgi:hypothetical protein
MKRIGEINASPAYRALGPWSLSDFRQVTDWRKVESYLHYAFRSLQDTGVVGRMSYLKLHHSWCRRRLTNSIRN